MQKQGAATSEKIGDRSAATFSKAALALLPQGSAVKTNGLDELSQAMLFR